MSEFHTTTTLNEIRACGPCADGWEILLNHLDKTQADDEPLELLTILESNGLDDALWCLRVPSLERLSRHFQAWCAEQVLHFFEAERPQDDRVRNQIATLRNDTATDAERRKARDAARASALAAVAQGASWPVSWDAAWDAARNAAWDAACSIACNTACSTASWDASWGASWDAARHAQEAQLRKMITKETFDE